MLTQNLLRRCVKKQVIDEATSAKRLAEIDLDNSENLLKSVCVQKVLYMFQKSEYLSQILHVR